MKVSSKSDTNWSTAVSVLLAGASATAIGMVTVLTAHTLTLHLM